MSSFSIPGVLAAASQFFADLLPNSELELDVCVSVELTFEEMSCVLEYIYSGKFQCLLQQRENILGILKDFGINIPNIFVPESASKQPAGKAKLPDPKPTSKVVQKDVIATEKTRSIEIVENRQKKFENCTDPLNSNFAPTSLSEKNGPKKAPLWKIANPKQSTIQLKKKTKLSNGNKRPNVFKTKDTNNKNFPVSKYKPLLPKPDVHISNNPATTPALGLPGEPLSLQSPILLLTKSYCQKTKQVEEVLPSNNSKSRGYVNNDGSEINTKKNPEIDDPLVKIVPDKEAISLQLPGPIQSTLSRKDSPTSDPLRTCPDGHFGSDCPRAHGDHDYFKVGEPHKSLTVTEGQPVGCNPPTSLISPSQRACSNPNDVSHPQIINQGIVGFIIKQSEIQNINQINRNVHILLNPPLNPPIYSILPERFPEQAVLKGQPSSKSGMSDEETIEDKDDFVLAENFLKAENKRRRLLKKKLQLMNRQLVRLYYYIVFTKQ